MAWFLILDGHPWFHALNCCVLKNCFWAQQSPSFQLLLWSLSSHTALVTFKNVDNVMILSPSSLDHKCVCFSDMSMLQGLSFETVRFSEFVSKCALLLCCCNLRFLLASQCKRNPLVQLTKSQFGWLKLFLFLNLSPGIHREIKLGEIYPLNKVFAKKSVSTLVWARCFFSALSPASCLLMGVPRWNST